MTNDKLRQLIARHNEQEEDNAGRRAAAIINEIAQCQRAKLDADTKIKELREELKKLEVPQLDETSILGG